MTPTNSKASIQQMSKTFVEQQEKRMAAIRNLDVPAANRHHMRAAVVAEALSSTPAGRAALEKLHGHPILHIRLSAAENAMKWAPDEVIPFLGNLLDADLSFIESPDERLDIRDRAKGMLYKHFDIRSWDRNDLIEPLRAYGVELSYRDRSKWQ